MAGPITPSTVCFAATHANLDGGEFGDIGPALEALGATTDRQLV